MFQRTSTPRGHFPQNLIPRITPALVKINQTKLQLPPYPCRISRFSEPSFDFPSIIARRRVRPSILKRCDNICPGISSPLGGNLLESRRRSGQTKSSRHARNSGRKWRLMREILLACTPASLIIPRSSVSPLRGRCSQRDTRELAPGEGPINYSD